MKISINKMNVVVQRQEQRTSAAQTASVFQKELERAAGSVGVGRRERRPAPDDVMLRRNE
jgi:hypothetical protein